MMFSSQPRGMVKVSEAPGAQPPLRKTKLLIKTASIVVHVLPIHELVYIWTGK